jgi:hypothetical protein
MQGIRFHGETTFGKLWFNYDGAVNGSEHLIFWRRMENPARSSGISDLENKRWVSQYGDST